MITVEAEPYAYQMPQRSTALIIIDMQRDFIEPGGFGSTLGNDVGQLAAIVPAVQKLLALFRARQWPVIHTREGHHADLSDLPPAKYSRGSPKLRIGEKGALGRILIDGEPGNQIIPALTPIPGEYDLLKPGKGAFYHTDLLEILAKLAVTHLVFAGVTTEVCVQTSMREANDRGFDCLLVEDCTASYFPEFKQATINMVKAQGAIVGWTAPLQNLLNAVGEVSEYA